MTCDRCGHVEEIRQDFRAYEWGRITAAQSNGPKWIGSMDGKTFKDLCPNCIGDLMNWWNTFKPAAIQKAEAANG
jgi:hypothetical protein